MGYEPDRRDLEQVAEERDLGVVFQDNLEFGKHMGGKVRKTNGTIGSYAVHFCMWIFQCLDASSNR